MWPTDAMFSRRAGEAVADRKASSGATLQLATTFRTQCASGVQDPANVPSTNRGAPLAIRTP